MMSNESKSTEELRKLQEDAEKERKRLEQELLKSAEDYLLKIQTMEVTHEEKVAKIIEQKTMEKEVCSLTLYLPITTAADDKSCNIFSNF